ncbi:hypothetical protein HYN86_14345 [Flavobacterium fluviale]|uniref:Uncharacterized protein n=1 Tax=Flavobacterium fluviale TaxID=2249356 RepID=A0A344LUX1_9FLAO|nr:hypothetical protein HYN86_14345 [Flavobacterium fluviale]
MQFFKRKNGKKESKEPVGARSRSAISPEGRRGAVMRMQVRAGTTLAALLTRLKLGNRLKKTAAAAEKKP